MNSLELVESFSEFKELKSIDKQTMQHVLEDVFRAMLKKKFNTDEHIDVIVNIEKGDVQIFVNKEIVQDGEVEDPNTEIAYSDAIKIEPDFEVGEEVSEEFKFEDFGRRNILSLRQNLISRILELEKDHIYKLYKERIGEIVTGEVYQVWKKEIMVLDDEGNELILPKSEQIPSDYFKKGESIRAVVAKVDMRNAN
ncbi:MAG: S1 RNA-binding domain-containing protein, partial [Crocinitomicaceae bacterium]|nr:S1 RNA-binding domain-containing protein [Crocinitomicaceae bacterium]